MTNKIPIYVTGNQHKADYLNRMLGVSLEHQRLELDEIQSVNVEEIVNHKVKQAFEILNKPVLVEDVYLSFDAINGLPGPFIKYFVEMPDGLEKLCRMLDGFDNRQAEAGCVFGYFDGSNFEIMRGSLRGEIADHPRGDNGFGWDKIFIPDGFDGLTRAELDPFDDERTYATIKPFGQLRRFLKTLS